MLESLSNTVIGNEINNESHKLIGVSLGLMHECGGVIIPSDTDYETRNRLGQLLREKYPNNSVEYIITRVCDAVSGSMVTKMLGDDYFGTLSNIEQDLFKKTDYILQKKSDDSKVLTVDFTQGNNGFTKKVNEAKPRKNHLIIEVNGKFLHRLIHDIGDQIRGNTKPSSPIEKFHEAIDLTYTKFKKDIAERFVSDIYPPIDTL